ncbi:MAG: hypothetical protein Kow0062_20760 [Acidobacteriota bacterium]
MSGPRRVAGREAAGRGPATSRRAFVRRAVWPAALMLAIALGSLRPLPVGFAGGSDKLVHAGTWSLLGAGWAHALGALAWPPLRVAGLAAGISAAWGGVDEAIQAGVPWRDADGGDLLADLLGAGAGAGAWLWYRRRRTGAREPGTGPGGR